MTSLQHINLSEEITSDVNAENSVVAAILVDPETFPEFAVEIRLEYFSDAINRKIFSACLSLLSKDVGIDPVTVWNYLESSGETNPDIKRHINEIYGLVITASHIKYHISIIKEKWKLRETLGLSKRMLSRIAGGCDYETIQTELFDFSGKMEHSESGSAHELVSLLGKEIRMYKHSLDTNIPVYSGIKSGFVAIDKYIVFMKHNLYVIAARPGMGKTSLLIKILENIVAAGKRILFFSAEMPEEEIMEKIVSMRTHTSTNVLREMSLEDKMKKYKSAYDFFEKYKTNFLIDDSVTNIEHIISQTLRYSLKYQIDLIAVDYLQLLSCSKGTNRNDEISEILRYLKQISKKINVPIIVLSQLNREVERRPNKRPILADLRDSGSIEQDASACLFIYRDEVYNPGTLFKGKTELIIAKHRFGPIGTRDLYFNKDCTLFTDYHVQQQQSQAAANFAQNFRGQP